MSRTLTIAIPTKDRPKYLHRCLASIFTAFDAYLNRISVTVSDNCSSPETEKVVFQLKEAGYKINYIFQETDLGAEGNIAFCIDNATGDYVWVMGDDDLVVDGMADALFEAIDSGCGLIHLGSVWQECGEAQAAETYNGSNSIGFSDVNVYLMKVSFMITFISANVVNRRLACRALRKSKNFGTELSYLDAYLSTIFSSNSNYFIEGNCVSALGNNSGGYKVFKVFGPNFDSILRQYYAFGLSRETYKKIVDDKLRRFFPNLISNASKSNFSTSGAATELISSYIFYKSFWLHCAPRLLKLGSLIRAAKNILLARRA